MLVDVRDVIRDVLEGLDLTEADRDESEEGEKEGHCAGSRADHRPAPLVPKGTEPVNNKSADGHR